ncbi:MAG: FtsQ-type POTRA domain-containing protein [Spirochaetales bacterium]|nr:FtsQ-type POTRA domain-containing protein [Spirochaetales bacterium]
MRTAEKILLVLVLVLIVAGAFIALRNIDFFNIEEIDVSVSGPVTNVPADMQRIINPLKGLNIFEVSLGKIRKSLEAFDGVKSVKISRFYPDKLIIDIEYDDVALRSYSISDDGVITYYFIHDDILEVVGQDTWESFDKLAVVEINPAYAQMIIKWGSDEGFRAMVAMGQHLAGYNLITDMKYDNNMGNEFGRLVIDISSLNSVLYVREQVSVRRLDEMLEIISSQFSAGGASVVYDLYANTWVKRT